MRRLSVVSNPFALAHLLPALFFLGLLAGCASEPEAAAPPAKEMSQAGPGEALYLEPHDDGNTFACSTCHALSEPAADGFTRPGHPIGDAALRPSYKNGQLSELIDAVNTCRQEWMDAPAFSEDDERWQMLRDFLTGEAETQVAAAGASEAPPLSFTIAQPPSDVSGGDPMQGLAKFNTSCAICHGQNAFGTERAPAIAGTLLPPEFIAQKVRRSGNPDSAVYPGLEIGRMPFWAPDRISDGELRDVIAFLEMSEMPTEVVVTADGTDLSQPGAQSECGQTHPAVGQSLTFSTNAHQVAGVATIVDDCTIALDDFSFDGGGIDVRLYGGSGGSFDLNLSVNMVGMAFDGSSAFVRLPAGVTLDDFDSMSVWCVPVGFDFGSGSFE